MSDRDWQIFTGEGRSNRVEKWPEVPPWRNFQPGKKPPRETFQTQSPEVVYAVNMGIYLRRPLLVTGKPGTGKSTLAKAIASELELGEILKWPINTRSTLQEGLYNYDAIARLQDAQLGEKEDIGKYITLGPLGTAMASQTQPRVLLIDEIDKSDIDLPNDLLNVFEDGYFDLSELRRRRQQEGGSEVTVQTFDGEEVPIPQGRVTCKHFPIVIMTSNGERDFPIPFKRRCIQLTMPEPDPDKLKDIVKAYLGKKLSKEIDTLIQDFAKKRDGGTLATDQLLNVAFLLMNEPQPQEAEKEAIKERLLKYLNETGG